METLKAELLKALVRDGLTVVLGIAVVGILGLLTGAKKWLDAKKSTSMLAALGARVAHIASGVVADLEATVRPELAKATQDGYLTKEEVLELRTMALTRLKTQLGTAFLDQLGQVLAGPAAVEPYLQGQLEMAVDGLPATVSPS